MLSNTFKAVGLKSYIDYYNRYRIKSKLSGMSPVEYRLQAARN
jgi:putative transposase